MQFKTVMIVFCMGLMAASCGGRSQRTMEIDPEGVNRPATSTAQSEPNWLQRLFGAESNRPNVGPCPLMGVLYDSARIVEFAQPGVQRYANVAFTGEMRGVRGLCRYVGPDPIRMGIEIDMAFGRGPAATAEHKTYRYWVAVTRRGAAAIQKQYFDVNVAFPQGQDVVTHAEQIGSIVIPRANPNVSGENFEILVGFELTPDQIAFNREGRRFRANAADASATPSQDQQPPAAPAPAAAPTP